MEKNKNKDATNNREIQKRNISEIADRASRWAETEGRQAIIASTISAKKIIRNLDQVRDVDVTQGSNSQRD